MNTARIFIGYDPRESVAYHTCAESIIRNSSIPVAIHPLYLKQLQQYQEKHTDGSNQFIYSRFLIPYLCNYKGWAIWLDGDMVVEGDIAELWDMKDPSKAVQVVKHNYMTRFPKKYMGNKNENYPRKNWSSVMIWHCENLAHKILTPDFVSKAAGSFLHRFNWLDNDQIGELPNEWNWLSSEYNSRSDARLYHYTIGIPAFREYENCDNASNWWKYCHSMNHVDDRNR